jgi:hypothetical protein
VPLLRYYAGYDWLGYVFQGSFVRGVKFYILIVYFSQSGLKLTQIAAIAFLATLTVAVSKSDASAGEYFKIDAPQVQLIEGGMLNEYSLDHEVSVAMHLESTTDIYREYMIVTEIRKIPQGITTFISVIPERTDMGEEEFILVPWELSETGKFQVRTFLISDLERPVVLSPVVSSETSVYDDRFDGMIKMQKSPCDGCCPAYVIEVYQNRTVVYEGYEYVEKPGRHVVQVSQSQIDELVTAVYATDFFALENGYGSGGEGAGTTQFTADINGEWNRVTYTHGKDVPSALLELEDRIHKILNTINWV